jgi:hypothetical protein
MILPEQLRVYNSSDDILTDGEGEEVFLKSW